MKNEVKTDVTTLHYAWELSYTPWGKTTFHCTSQLFWSSWWVCKKGQGHRHSWIATYNLKSVNTKWASAWQNQQNDLCTQQRHRSAWASVQSAQSLRCPHKETLDPELPIERTAETLIWLGGWVFAGRTGHFVGFVALWPKYEHCSTFKRFVCSHQNQIKC